MDVAPLVERREQLEYGIGVIGVRSQIVASLDFQTAVERIFKVQLLMASSGMLHAMTQKTAAAQVTGIFPLTMSKNSVSL